MQPLSQEEHLGCSQIHANRYGHEEHVEIYLPYPHMHMRNKL